MVYDPTFWVLVAFIIIITLFGKKGWGKGRELLNNRIYKIKETVEEARLLSEQAQELFFQVNQDALQITKKIQEIQLRTEKEMDFLTKEHENKLKILREQKESQLIKRMQTLNDQALIDLRQEMSDLVYEISKSIIKERAKEEASLFMEEGLSIFPNKLSLFG